MSPYAQLIYSVTSITHISHHLYMQYDVSWLLLSIHQSPQLIYLQTRSRASGPYARTTWRALQIYGGNGWGWSEGCGAN